MEEVRDPGVITESGRRAQLWILACSETAETVRNDHRGEEKQGETMGEGRSKRGLPKMADPHLFWNKRWQGMFQLLIQNTCKYIFLFLLLVLSMFMFVCHTYIHTYIHTSNDTPTVYTRVLCLSRLLSLSHSLKHTQTAQHSNTHAHSLTRLSLHLLPRKEEEKWGWKDWNTKEGKRAAAFLLALSGCLFERQEEANKWCLFNSGAAHNLDVCIFCLCFPLSMTMMRRERFFLVVTLAAIFSADLYFILLPKLQSMGQRSARPCTCSPHNITLPRQRGLATRLQLSNWTSAQQLDGTRSEPVGTGSKLDNLFSHPLYSIQTLELAPEERLLGTGQLMEYYKKKVARWERSVCPSSARFNNSI